MGYYTKYQLDVDPTGMIITVPLGELVTEVDLLTDSEKSRMVQKTVGVYEEVVKQLEVGYGNPFHEANKWYEHERDMKSISRDFPAVVFTLSGIGEENSDMWVKYFKNGKVQVCRAKITFDKYNETELK